MQSKKISPSLEVNQVHIEFTPKAITPYGGIASIVAKFLEKIDFRSWVAKNVPIEEHSNNSGGIYEKVLAQLLVSLVGGFRFSHLWFDRGVEVLLSTLGVAWLPSSASTLTRFWNKINTQGAAERLGEAARKFASQMLEWSGVREGNLSFDSSVITLYGEQEGAKKGYNPHKSGRKSHHPLFAFAGGGFVVNLWNRSGNVFSSHRIVEFFDQTMESLRTVPYKVKRVLCDSGFYLLEFIKHLEDKGLTYIIAVRLYAPLQSCIMKIDSWKKIDEGIEVAEFFFEHADKKWDKPRRYVVVRQSIDKRPKAGGKQPSLFEEFDEWKNYRVSIFVTNDADLPPEEVWREYCHRAGDENVIKNVKDGYGVGSFNMQNFWATEAVMLMGALIFHNMIRYMDRKFFNPAGASQTLQTLRSSYFVIGAMLGARARRKVLRLSVDDRKLKSKIVWMLEQISRIPHSLNFIAVDSA